jgi:predicted dehydrogenase
MNVFSENNGIWILHNGEESFQPVKLEERFWYGSDPVGSSWDSFIRLMQTQSIGSRRFVDAILGKEKVEATFYDGWKAQLVIDAALASHRTGKWVMVSTD